MLRDEMRTVRGFPNYAITRDGRIWSKPRRNKLGRYLNGKWMKFHPTHENYLSVMLYRNGSHIRKFAHRLMLETFVGPCPEGMEACHNNGDVKDNRIENLRWDTHSANVQDAVRHGTCSGYQRYGENNYNAKVTEDAVKVMRYLRDAAKFSFNDLAWQFGVHYNTVKLICKGRTWRHLLEN